MDKPLIEHLVEKHIYKDGQGIKCDNKGILEELESMGKPTKRRTLENWIAKLDKEEIYIRSGKASKDDDFKRSVSIDGNGVHSVVDVIAMTDEQAKDTDFVLQAFGYDPSKWAIINCTSNLWSVDGKDKRLNNYQFKVKVKPKTTKDLIPSDFKAILDGFKVKKVDLPKPTQNNSKTALEVDFTDMHIGSEFQNLQYINQKIADIKNEIENKKVERVQLCFLGDILHADNANETTAKGTQLKLKSTAYEMVRSGLHIITNIIRELAIVDTEVYWVQGNHSRLAEFMLFQIVEKEFKDTHIRFYNDESLRKAFLFGKNLIGLTHGDIPRKNMDSWLMYEFPELWGQARYWEIHSGHLHEEAVKSHGSMKIRTLPTVKATDEYENSLGYRNDFTKIQTFLWHKTEGLKQISYF